jgi:hypothetical protein
MFPEKNRWLFVLRVLMVGVLFLAMIVVGVSAEEARIDVSNDYKVKIEKALQAFANEIIKEEIPRPRAMLGELKQFVNQNPDVFGAAFAYAPQEREGRPWKAAPYVFRGPHGLEEKILPSSYDYTSPEVKWYAEPVRLRKPVWCDPYYDEGGAGAGVKMITYSIPAYNDNAELLGVITADVRLSIAPDVLAVLKQFGDAYAKRDLELIRSLILPGPDTTMIGTGKDEKCVGLEAILSQIKRDWEQAESFTMEWKDSQVKSEGTAAWVMGDCLGKAMVKGESIELLMRYTAVLVRMGERWLIAQTHFSLPAAGQEEGSSFPKK